MIDLGFAQVPMEVFSVIAIATALCLAALYIGFYIIAAIIGVVAVIYGLRVSLYGSEIVVGGYVLGPTEGWLLAIIGAFLVYRGTVGLFEPDGANSWR